VEIGGRLVQNSEETGGVDSATTRPGTCLQHACTRACAFAVSTIIAPMSSAQLVAHYICSPPVVTRMVCCMDGSELVRAPARAEFDRLLNILSAS
jgi:hypothetical protein